MAHTKNSSHPRKDGRKSLLPGFVNENTAEERRPLPLYPIQCGGAADNVR